MTEKLVGFKTESLPPLNDWQEVVGLPVVNKEKPWNINDLEDILRESVGVVVTQALKVNNGVIYVTLSGGVDSSLCLAMIAELCSPATEIHTFTLGGSKNHPDILYGRQVAQMFGTTHHEIIAGPKEKEKIIKEFLDFYGDSPETRSKIDRGDINAWALYREIVKYGAKGVIASDGIDELMGGYWPHCETSDDKAKQEEVFRIFWQKLQQEHLVPLEAVAHHFGVGLLFPYLQRKLVEYISCIPVNERAGYTLNEKGWKMPNRKKPLIAVAKKYVFPQYVSQRQDKFGLVSALNSKPPYK